jgi:hypothetical protein
MNHATRSQAITQCQSRPLSFRSYGTEGNAHTMITSRSFFPSKVNSRLKLVDEQAGSILFVGHSSRPESGTVRQQRA